MINQTILFLPQTDCTHPKLKPYADELVASVFFDQDSHFGRPLQMVFEKVIRFEIGESYANDGVIKANMRIVEIVKERSPKYVIWPTRTYEILEETFLEIRKLGSYVIGWFFDDETRFDNYSRWWIPYMDYILTADKSSVARYQQLGAKAYHLLVTCEPDDFKPLKVEVDLDVSFVGSKYVADRDRLVNHLINDGVSISTFGKGWENGFVSHDEMVQIFSNSKINICFTKADGTGTRNQLKGKIFDITMCGGFLLCEYAEGIEDIFDIGKEIVCFNDYPEALEKINYYLKNDEIREQIAMAGKQRATRDLAQHKLFENVFTAIEIDNEANAERNILSVSVLQMPKHIKMAHAQFHFKWANVLKKVGFNKEFWNDELNLSCIYEPELIDISFFKINKCE